MTNGLAFWLVLAGGTAAAAGLAERLPRPAVGLALATFAVLVVGILATPAPSGDAAAFPARERLAAARPDVAPPPSAEPTPTPAATPAPPASAPLNRPRPPSPARIVRDYYAALDRGAFRTAWRRLSPTVRVAFGGFVAWKAGYASTVSHRVTRLRRDGRTVTYLLHARDAAPCGGVVARTFTVRWEFAGRRARSLTAAPAGGGSPGRPC